MARSTINQARAACDRSRALAVEATRQIDDGQLVCDVLRTTWRNCLAGLRLRVDEFRLEGTLEDGVCVSAFRVRGHFVCDDALRRRAELLIAMDEEFTLPGAKGRYHATLDAPPVAVALTLARAMRVRSFELRLPEGVVVSHRNDSVNPHPSRY